MKTYFMIYLKMNTIAFYNYLYGGYGPALKIALDPIEAVDYLD